MVALGILVSVVLVISNMVVPFQAYILIGMGRTYTLAMMSVFTWVVLWAGIHWLLFSQKTQEDDTYKF